MKFTISSGDLEKALSAVIGVVPSKATLPILEMVHFSTQGDHLVLTATDLEITIVEHVQADISEEGNVAIPAKRLLDLLKSTPDVPVHFNVDGNHTVTFKTDRASYKLVGVEGEEFPNPPALDNGSGFDIAADVFKSCIRKTAFAVSSDDLRPAMMGVFFQVGESETKIVATDGHRLVKLVRHDVTVENGRDFIVPEKALNLVSRIQANSDTFTVEVFDDHAIFVNGTSKIITRLINETYPNYESVIPTENEKSMIVDREEMASAVKRASIFSSSTTRQIRLDISSDKLIISAEDMDMSSSAKEDISCEYNFEPMLIGFNARYLADVLGNIEDNEVVFEFSTPNRAGIVKPVEQADHETMLMLVMPVMLNTNS